MDDASSALIQQLLAEDQEYAMAAGYYEDPSSDEEETKRKRKRKGKPGSRGKKGAEGDTVVTPKKKATKASPAEQPLNEDSDYEESKPKKKRNTPRRWTEAEEDLFIDGLEQFGRNWKKISEHLNQLRTPRDIASHAQKHFIKLFKENLPLPEKVRESGEGYTLSGKPLDPGSAAARAYGLRGSSDSKAYREEIVAKKANQLATSVDENEAPNKASLDHPEEAFSGLLGLVEASDTQGSNSQSVSASQDTGSDACINLGPVEPLPVSQMSLEELELEKQKRTCCAHILPPVLENPPTTDIDEVKLEAMSPRARNELGVVNSASNSAKIKGHSGASAQQRKKDRETKQQQKKQEAWDKKLAKVQQVYGEDGRTEYSRNRSRRRVTNKFIAPDSETLQFVAVSTYIGSPTTGPKSQPFHVKVHSSVYAAVDLHSHLSTAEVMGFLAGKFDPVQLTITVEKAFPGTSTLNGETECEMDPVSEVKIKAEIVSQGLSVVGWYHSHPTFQPVPSQCDVVNQANYQLLFRDAASDTEPFLGLIFSPYDARLPSARSQFSWFYVESPRINKTAKRIETSLLCDSTLSDDTVERMQMLVQSETVPDASKFGNAHSVNFKDTWTVTRDQQQMTYLDKLRTSLSFWLPPLVYSLAANCGEQEAPVESSKTFDDPEKTLDMILESLDKPPNPEPETSSSRPTRSRRRRKA